METKTKKLEALQKKLGTSAKTMKGLMAALKKIAEKNLSIPIYARGQELTWSVRPAKHEKYIKSKHALSGWEPNRQHTAPALLRYSTGEPYAGITSYYDGNYSGAQRWPIVRYRFVFDLHPSAKGKEDIGGLITAKLSPTDVAGVQACKWFKLTYNSQKLVTGYLVRGNYHSTKKTPQAALAEYKIAQRKKIDTYITTRKQRIDSDILSRTWVTTDDSISGGNCKVGTIAFVDRFKTAMAKQHGWGEVGAVRADFLQKIESSIFTRKAILAAISRQK